MIKTEYLLITPEAAKQMLEKNTKINRAVRASHITWLAGMIERDEFTTTHQGIAFSDDGSLIDGQHRLHAIIMANKAVVMSVTTGLDNNAFDALDVGIKRTMYDLTRIDRKVVEALSFIFYNIKANGRLKPSAKQIEELYNTNIGKLIEDISNKMSTSRRCFGSSGVKVAAASCILLEDNYDYVIDQYIALNNGDFDKMNGVSRALYRMEANGSVKASNSANGIEVFWRCYQCFSKTYFGNTLNKFSEQNVQMARDIILKALSVKK